jgi:transposase
MATKRLSMRQIKEILRQKLLLKRSNRDIGESVGRSAGAVWDAVDRAKSAGIEAWDAVEEVGEDELELRLYPHGYKEEKQRRPEPDCVWVHAERKKGVTLELLHAEYLQRNPGGYQYTVFCDRYRQWLRKHRLSMRQVHRAGERLFVDYSGNRPCLTDPQTGERTPVELFVAVLGASNLTYVEATLSQRGPDWIGSHMRAFEYLGGVTALVTCDQLKSGVTKSCRYDPEIQRTYEEMAQHYGTAVMPARPKKPRDKAKAETGVLVAQRWVLMRLRRQTFFTLDELNARIRELLEELNNRVMRLYGASRRELFERLDRPALRPLPARRFVYGDWITARVNLDYHVLEPTDHHFYSVPHVHVGDDADVRVSATTVEVYLRGERVASHVRSHERGGATTVAEHMPKAHRAHLEWTPSRIIAWAERVGPETQQLVAAILKERPHPEMGYRSCLGLLRLGQRYGDERLEAACRRAFLAGARSYRHVHSVLKNGLDRVPLPEVAPSPRPPLPPHENVRGSKYYN